MLDNITIGSRFMQKIIEKAIEKAIYKSTGANIKIRFTDAIKAEIEGETVKLHVSLDTEIDKTSIERLIEGEE